MYFWELAQKREDMIFLLGIVLWINAVSAQFIEIEIANTTIEYGLEDVDVLCRVTNGSSLNSVFTIQLKRSGTSVVSATPGGVSWQDTSLENRNGVIANGSVNDVMNARLHLNIPMSSVVYPDDEGDYQCTMSGLDLMSASVNAETRTVFVNITDSPSGTPDPSASGNDYGNCGSPHNVNSNI
ncbi:uncharacterized protein LOC133203533 [Saccostrea echinata]|uniref:uncharacterized protein LOC133203533 n=1 Tax=Saccostrea echinata TaxID=191078 RepID=UPI002A823B39|nr:uncharacterized protein LOC133203533 [Saccostrea echinata]